MDITQNLFSAEDYEDIDIKKDKDEAENKELFAFYEQSLFWSY